MLSSRRGYLFRRTLRSPTGEVFMSGQSLRLQGKFEGLKRKSQKDDIFNRAAKKGRLLSKTDFGLSKKGEQGKKARPVGVRGGAFPQRRSKREMVSPNVLQPQRRKTFEEKKYKCSSPSWAFELREKSRTANKWAKKEALDSGGPRGRKQPLYGR